MFALVLKLILFYSVIAGYSVHFGNAFNESCNEKCLTLKSKVTECDERSGICLYGCVPGWYGKDCSKPCINTCLNRACFQDSGRCLDGCLTGLYGSKCNKPCWSSCANKSCIQDSGRCSDGCVTGWYGDICSKPCKSTCLHKSCLRDSGSCMDECVTGWYGDKCNKPCSSSCFNRTCLQTSGYCSHGCILGWYGKMCNLSCADTCQGNYCDRETYACLQECDIGYMGLYCNKTSNIPISNSNQFVGGLVGVVISLIFVLIVWLIRRFLVKGKDYSSLKFSTTDNTEPKYNDIYYLTGLEERESKLNLDLEAGYKTVQSTC